MKLHPDALKVGKKYANGYFDYKDIQYNDEGWAFADVFLPAEFDLCKVRTKQGKYKMAWWCGNLWEGLKISHKDVVIAWKRWVE